MINGCVTDDLDNNFILDFKSSNHSNQRLSIQTQEKRFATSQIIFFFFLAIKMYDFCTLGLISFLIQSHAVIEGYPICGNIKDLMIVYFSANDHLSNKIENSKKSFEACHEGFRKALQALKDIDPSCFDITDDVIHGEKIININEETLEIVYNCIHRRELSTTQATQQLSHGQPLLIKTSDSTSEASNADLSLEKRLLTLIEMDTTSEDNANNKMPVDSTSPNAHLYSRLESTLKKETAFKSLYREKIVSHANPKPYTSVCSDSEHGKKILHFVKIHNNKISAVNDLRGITHIFSQTEVSCLQTHTHFIPNLKPHTDMSLGDCSYLDTCHKLNTCRYVHYIQCSPLLFRKNESFQKENKLLEASENPGLFTHGENTKRKELLPKQWIKCDIRKFDFRILGKFSCVIADPAWNIHMNLPYGTCNDNELLAMPLNLLQDEGIIFLWVTGRSIQLGKESLEKWGYRVINEISWIKVNQLGRTIVTGRTGHWLNHSKEHLLVGIKGSPVWLNKQQYLDLIVSYTRETSRKPDELYGMCERLCGKHARKLEIFGRDHNTRPGWFTIGNQLKDSCVWELDVKTKHEKWLSGRAHENVAVKNKSQNYRNKPSEIFDAQKPRQASKKKAYLFQQHPRSVSSTFY